MALMLPVTTGAGWGLASIIEIPMEIQIPMKWKLRVGV